MEPFWVAYVEYQPEHFRLTGPVAPDDLTLVSYPSKNGDRIRLRQFDGKAWQPAIDVTEAAWTSGGRPWPSTAKGASGSPGPSTRTATGRSSAGPTPPAKEDRRGTCPRWSA